ncbi:MAG: CRISPR-associated endoribonuclease Cas6 [Erysipelotrichaceae bacterium]|nr:CRISPR-associated endoribonuclease Cas6 [Erysipelotrichaceae bacterium]
MRLEIKLACKELTLPIAYKHILQAVIYNMLDQEAQSSFYHDEGYHVDEKVYKMFVFSDLLGEYEVKNKHIIFNNDIKFYIDSMDAPFIQSIYQFLQNNAYLYIAKQRVKIEGISIFKTPVFKGVQSITIQTLSPVVAYKSKDKYVTYYKPGDSEFEELIRDNIKHKCQAYRYPTSQISFDIEEIVFAKKRLVHFKDNFYEAYHCQLKVRLNYDAFKVIYETGLSAKGSSGFGMIYRKNEKSMPL